jgi:hypothetical protein
MTKTYQLLPVYPLAPRIAMVAGLVEAIDIAEARKKKKGVIESTIMTKIQ